MTWETVKRIFRIGKEIGFRLLREDCRHCNGEGICRSGHSKGYNISCASCQHAILGEIRTHIVRCDVCGGRGVFVYALPDVDQFKRVTMEVLPQQDGSEWSTVRMRTPPPVRRSPSDAATLSLPDRTPSDEG